MSDFPIGSVTAEDLPAGAVFGKHNLLQFYFFCEARDGFGRFWVNPSGSIDAREWLILKEIRG